MNHKNLLKFIDSFLIGCFLTLVIALLATNPAKAYDEIECSEWCGELCGTASNSDCQITYCEGGSHLCTGTWQG